MANQSKDNPKHDKLQQGDDNRRPQEQFPSSGSGARRPDASEESTQRPSQQQPDRDRSIDMDEDDQAQAASGRSKSSSKSSKSSMNRDDSSGSKSSQSE